MNTASVLVLDPLGLACDFLLALSMVSFLLPASNQLEGLDPSQDPFQAGACCPAKLSCEDWAVCPRVLPMTRLV